MPIKSDVLKNTVSSNGKEKAFITEVYNYILSFKNYNIPTVSCDTTVSAQFAEGVEKPTFNFTITPNFVIRMKRKVARPNAAYQYTFSVIINGTVSASEDIAFTASGSAAADTESARRSFFFICVLSSMNSFVWIGDYNVTNIENASITFGSISDTDNIRYGTGYSGCNPELATYYKSKSDEENNVASGIGYTVGNLFDYESEAGYIEYVSHVSFINADQEQFRSEEFMNCSEISQGRSIAISSTSYFSVGPHTLIAIK